MSFGITIWMKPLIICIKDIRVESWG